MLHKREKKQTKKNDSTMVLRWQYQMVTQNMLHLHEETQVLFVDALNLIKCLKQVILQGLIHTCAPISELPSYKSTMDSTLRAIIACRCQNQDGRFASASNLVVLNYNKPKHLNTKPLQNVNATNICNSKYNVHIYILRVIRGQFK